MIQFRCFQPSTLALPVILGLSLLVGGCASGGADGPDVYEMNKQDRFVKLDPIEAGAAANNHPQAMTAQQIQAYFSNLTATGNLALADGPTDIFTDNELAEIAAPIAAALTRAQPNQDVVFQSAGARGLFGSYSVPSYTTGRVFVSGGELNLILGQVHERPNSNVSDFYIPPFEAATRSRAVETSWQLDETHGKRADARNDWIRFDLASVPAIKAAQEDAGQDEPSSAEKRLRTLDDLKAKGLISDQEYQQQRQTILNDI